MLCAVYIQAPEARPPHEDIAGPLHGVSLVHSAHKSLVDISVLRRKDKQAETPEAGRGKLKDTKTRAAPPWYPFLLVQKRGT